jgi:hypothetical protein
MNEKQAFKAGYLAASDMSGKPKSYIDKIVDNAFKEWKKGISLILISLSLLSCTEEYKPELNKVYYDVCTNCTMIKTPCDTIYYTPISCHLDSVVTSIGAQYKTGKKCELTKRTDTLHNDFFKKQVKPLK